MQQASDTKDGGSKIMESLSSMDEGDQVAEPSLRTDLETLRCTSKCMPVHTAAMQHIPQQWKHEYDLYCLMHERGFLHNIYNLNRQE